MLIPGKSYKGELPPLTFAEHASVERIHVDVAMLAGTIGERNTGNPEALHQAESFIADRLQRLGYSLKREQYDVSGIQVSNVIAELRGTSKADEIVLVGAHYDSAQGTPGANDNASGVAVLMELAEYFRGVQSERTVRFVFFVNEEPPYFGTELMGSRINAEGAKSRKENIVAMLCLECLGVYSDQPGSQRYPGLLEQLYPDRGNFIAFCGNLPSFRLLRDSISVFRKTTPFPSEGIIAPESLEGIAWSDHSSFWQEGYPAIMLTDTAFFRYDAYHMPTDRPDRLDYPRMARLTSGLCRIVEHLAGDI